MGNCVDKSPVEIEIEGTGDLCGIGPSTTASIAVEILRCCYGLEGGRLTYKVGDYRNILMYCQETLGKYRSIPNVRFILVGAVKIPGRKTFRELCENEWKHTIYNKPMMDTPPRSLLNSSRYLSASIAPAEIIVVSETTCLLEGQATENNET